MGFLNDDTADQQSQASAVVDQQINENKALLEDKKNRLIQTRIDLIKGQGQEQWTPAVPAMGTRRVPEPSLPDAINTVRKNTKGVASVF